MNQQTLTPLRQVGADLRLVNAVEARYEATVLTDNLIDRLSVTNRACRALRDMGYRIVNHDLQMEKYMPRIKIALTERQSVAPLLDAASTMVMMNEIDGSKHGSVFFMNAKVIWEMP